MKTKLTKSFIILDLLICMVWFLLALFNKEFCTIGFIRLYISSINILTILILMLVLDAVDREKNKINELLVSIYKDVDYLINLQKQDYQAINAKLFTIKQKLTDEETSE